jgi:hypothetical protein
MNKIILDPSKVLLGMGFSQLETLSPGISRWANGNDQILVDAVKQQVKSVNGESWEPYNVAGSVYRGQYGSAHGYESQLESLSFSEYAAARTYALEPNDSEGQLGAPRIFESKITINNPFIVNFDDPFIDAEVIIGAIGLVAATRALIRLSPYIENTNNWYELEEETGASCPEEFIEKYPSRVTELYLDIYPVLDDPIVIELLKQAGYDGAVHVGNNVTSEALEYRVFNPKNAVILSVLSAGELDISQPDAKIVDLDDAVNRALAASIARKPEAVAMEF